MFPLLSALPSLSSLSLADQILQSGMWVYLLVFLVILLASTIVGGPIPDNTFLLLAGAVASGDGLSMELLLIVAMAGGFAGYEINYWSGRLFGNTVCKRGAPCTIEVSFTMVDGSYTLSISDNGIGLPPDVDLRNTQTLGLKLVNFLARHQLRATVEVLRNNGTEFRFRFKDPLGNKERP